MSIFGINHPRKDALLTATMSIPGTGKTEYSSVLDLTQSGGIDGALIVIEHDAMPNLAAAKAIAATLQESADGGATWKDVPCVALKALAGASAGVEAGCFKSRIPVDVAELIRLKVVADASSGDNAGASISLFITV